MEVKKIAGYEQQAVQKLQDAAVKPQSDEENVRTKDAALPQQDKVQLSDASRELAQVNKVMMERESIRTDLVEPLRQKIQDGSYPIDADKIARKMLDEVW